MSVYKPKGRNYWKINLTLGGHRIHKKAGNTRKEALAVEAELKTKYRLRQLHIEDIRDECPPFFQVAAEYLRHVETTKSPRLFELEYSDYNKHLHTFFGPVRADEIDTDLLYDFQTKQKNAGLANRTVNLHIGLVRKIVNYGKGKKYIRESFQLKYPMLSEPVKRHAFLDFDEWEKLRNNISYDMGVKRAVFGRQTGLRPGELAHLEWNDVSFQFETVTVRSKPDVKWRIKTNQERVVPLGKDALQILRDLYERKKSRWVFSNTDRPVKSIRRALDTAAKKAGIAKKVTPNVLRHSFACHALERGGSLRSLQEILGHAHISTTEKYLHAIPHHLKATAACLDSPAPVKKKKKAIENRKPFAKTSQKNH